MSKQTAVDLFHDRVMELLRGAKSVNSNTVAIIWIECKAVEREQIENAVKEMSPFVGELAKRVAQEYYDEKYGKK